MWLDHERLTWPYCAFVFTTDVFKSETSFLHEHRCNFLSWQASICDCKGIKKATVILKWTFADKSAGLWPNESDTEWYVVYCNVLIDSNCNLVACSEAVLLDHWQNNMLLYNLVFQWYLNHINHSCIAAHVTCSQFLFHLLWKIHHPTVCRKVNVILKCQAQSKDWGLKGCVEILWQPHQIWSYCNYW